MGSKVSPLSAPHRVLIRPDVHSTAIEMQVLFCVVLVIGVVFDVELLSRAAAPPHSPRTEALWRVG